MENKEVIELAEREMARWQERKTKSSSVEMSLFYEGGASALGVFIELLKEKGVIKQAA